MKLTSLPKFDVPDLPHKTIPAQIYEQWTAKGYEDAVKNGAVEKHRNDPLAIPVDKRFVLK